jgi:hypothetical protein
MTREQIEEFIAACRAEGAASDWKAEIGLLPLRTLDPAPRPPEARKGWNTDTTEFASAINEFETALPGFWWSVGQCSVGAHASCAVDGMGCQSELLDGIEAGHSFDSGYPAPTSHREGK